MTEAVHVGEESARPHSRLIDVLGVRTLAGTFENAVDLVLDRAVSGDGGFVVQCNVHVLVESRRDVRLREALDEAWLVMPDGAPVAWLQAKLHDGPAERVGGPDLMDAILDRGRPSQLRHFFLGSTQDTLDHLVARITDRYPGVEVAGTHAPPFGATEEIGEEAALIASAARPDVIWVALGAPKQERWIREQAHLFGGALVFGVGAAFDFHAGAKRRAPRWVQGMGLEWLHRLASEPRRLAGRYVRTNSAFLWRATFSVVRSSVGPRPAAPAITVALRPPPPRR